MTTLALVPARAGSKGLAGKNLARLAGVPLVGHAIAFARGAGLDDVLVSTDSPEIAGFARDFGADAPFLRPAELATDEAPMWPVVRHALSWCDSRGSEHEAVLLVPPTTPFRRYDDVARMLARLDETPGADGVVAVARPQRNPLWVTVVDRGGWMAYAWPPAGEYGRRQDVPAAYEITGSLYLWRASFVRANAGPWQEGRHLLHVTPSEQAIDVDAPADLALAEVILAAGLVELPWLR